MTWPLAFLIVGLAVVVAVIIWMVKKINERP